MTLLLGGYNILYSGNNSTAKYLFNLHVDLVIDILLVGNCLSLSLLRVICSCYLYSHFSFISCYFAIL